ncbi:MAG: hypothetical protein EOM22_17625 [Gammaproteobacteria bacterium]|nr:hypothetical protein [Gammaproteobacteria bacterium]
MNARNDFNALTTVPQWAAELITDVEKAGAFTRGIESDKKLRGSAINVDLYGHDAAQGLAVIQVREAQFRPGRFTRVRKDYYLIGHTETGATFAHPVETPARSQSAMESPEACVAYVLAKIWNCRVRDLGDIERQGDVAFVPVTRIPASAAQIVNGEAVMIRDTHRLTGDVWRDTDGTLYTRRGARLVHTKRQHAPVKAKAGVYRVQPGIRAQTWGFTAPHGD